MIADTLAAEYAEARAEAAERRAARAEAYAQAVIDEKIKAQVREQVEAELRSREKQESVSMEKALKANYVHVISNDMNVAVLGTDESCSLTAGDIVKVAKTPASEDETVGMTVVTSKKGNCPPNKKILVSLNDLQDMKNNFSESIDKALVKLSEEQGKGGLPTAPKEAQGKPKEVLTEEEKDVAIHEAQEAAKEIENP